MKYLIAVGIVTLSSIPGVASETKPEKPCDLIAVETYRDISEALTVEKIDVKLEAFSASECSFSVDIINRVFDAATQRNNRLLKRLDPYNDELFTQESEYLGEIVRLRYFDSKGRTVALKKEMDAEWMLYKEIHEWQKEKPDFSDLERFRETRSLVDEILTLEEFSGSGVAAK